MLEFPFKMSPKHEVIAGSHYSTSLQVDSTMKVDCGWAQPGQTSAPNNCRNCQIVIFSQKNRRDGGVRSMRGEKISLFF